MRQVTSMCSAASLNGTSLTIAVECVVWICVMQHGTFHDWQGIVNATADQVEWQLRSRKWTDMINAPVEYWENAAE